jgi:DNA mismatch repair protein MutL
MPIRLLRPDVSSKIAAGEVIERPASAVKELIENSLDAGATRISVEVSGGGSELIRISDNGVGIPADEVALAFQRFATSKVFSADDLNGIATLGFRGEALPSISAVSRVTLVTRNELEEAGTKFEVHDGETVSQEPTGAPIGTTITVRQLFRNLPARQKFLKTVGTENSRIQLAVTRYALAHPEVRFELNPDKGRKFASPGNGDLRSVVAAVYGLENAEGMLDMSPSDEDELAPKVWGMVSPPSMDRANRNYICFFVNRRWVQNRFLSFALEQAYHGFMAERRFPMGVVNINMPYEDVDVNAHPAKAEVRFLRENQVFGAVQQAVRQALVIHSPVPEIRRSTSAYGHSPSTPQATSGAFWPTMPFSRPPVSERAQLAEIAGWTSDHEAHPTESGGGGSPTSESMVPKDALPMLRVLGQVQTTYIAAEGPDGMYLIDQHAAHERVMFERVRAEAVARNPRVQSLLEPAMMQLNTEQQELLETQTEIVGALGFAVEPFGGDTFLIRGVPSLLGEGDPAGALVDILDLMAEGGGFESWEERAAYSIACHSAIRAGKVLTHQEMMELIRQLENCDQPNTCPHGRPTMIHLSLSHLEREFGRT